jgi:hypothetical protein
MQCPRSGHGAHNGDVCEKRARGLTIFDARLRL